MRIKRCLLSAVVAVAAAIQTGHAASQEPKIVDAFAIDLYQQLDAKPGNLFFSPMSVHSALAMVYAGANATTADQMKTTLHYAEAPAKLGESYSKLLDAINKIPETRDHKKAFDLTIANAAWGQQGFEFRPEYLAQVKDLYHAQLNSLDFAQSDAAKNTINQWVDDQTRGKIKNLIPDGVLNAATRLVLTNAVYFKSAWQHPFSDGATKDAPFTLADGTKIDVPTMQIVDQFAYRKTDTMEIIDLPYERGALSMTIFSPLKPDGLAQIEKDLKPETFASELRHARVALSMPKFKIEQDTPLSDVLKKMGMTDAFDSAKANFSGMTSGNDLFLSAVLHKAYIDVNEKGTEAAAATAAVIALRSMPIRQDPIEMRLDKPFLFVIRHQETGAILFMGRVSNPKG